MAFTTACITPNAMLAARPASVSNTCCVQTKATTRASLLRSSSAFRGQQFSGPSRSFVKESRANGLAVHASALTDVGKYLSDAAKQIFSPTTSEVQWPEASAFSGQIVHHEDSGRVRKLYETLKTARQQIEGCTDPNATNYQPGATSDDGGWSFYWFVTVFLLLARRPFTGLLCSL